MAGIMSLQLPNTMASKYRKQKMMGENTGKTLAIYYQHQALFL